MSNMLGEFRSAHNQQLWKTDLPAYRELAELIWKCEPDYREYIEQCLEEVDSKYRVYDNSMLSYDEMFNLFYGNGDPTNLFGLSNG